MNGTSKFERRLRLACEISADHVIAARATEHNDAIETCTVRSLPSGAVTPGLTNANIVNRESVAAAVSDALATVGTNHREIIAVIPDATCRIAFLEFDTLPDKPQEAESIVRFRLKKSLPFEVEHARLSYDVQPCNGSLRVITVVALPGIIEEYEAAFRDAGYNPGFVIPSTLASLGTVDASRPTLVVKIAPDVTSLAILNQDNLLLYRIMENIQGGTVDPAQLAEEVYPSLVFFHDTYHLKIERILIGGAAAFDPLAKALETGTGVRAQELVPQHALSSTAVSSAQRPFVAGIMGALIS